MKIEELEKFCTYWNREGESTIPIYQVIEVAQNILPKLIEVAKAAKTHLKDSDNLGASIEHRIRLANALEELEGKRKVSKRPPEENESKMKVAANMAVMLHNAFMDKEFREFAIERGLTLTKIQILENILAELLEISLSDKEKEHLEQCVKRWEISS